MHNKLNIHFTKLKNPTPELAQYFSKWENDPDLVHLIRPNPNETVLQEKKPVTVDELISRLEHHQFYLINMENQLIGEMDFQIDPAHLCKKEPGTAWIGITIGEVSGRGRGIGYHAIEYLEEQIKLQGLKRAELGVFEFNTPAINLYLRRGFTEFARIDDFTFWRGKMWQDIRMEKYF